MAKRWIDGPGIYDHGWDEATRDVFVWLFSVGSDTCGMQREAPARVAEDTGRSLRAVRAAIATLIADGTVVRYKAAGHHYLALVNWQDVQGISYVGKHTCPVMPAEEFAKLSRATRERAAKMLARHYAARSQEPPDWIFCSLPPKGGSKDSATSRASEPGLRPCGWCAHPVAPDDLEQPEVKRLVQVYHDRYRAAHGACPTISGGKDFGAVKRKLGEGRPFAEVAQVIAHGIASEDAYLRKRGYPLADLMGNYDGIALALRRRETHGARPGSVPTPPPKPLRSAREVVG